MNRNKLFLNSAIQKAAEFSGVAVEELESALRPW